MAHVHLGLVLPNYGEALGAERLASAATAAEGAGFDSGWVTDHVIVPSEYAPVYGAIAEALVSLGFLAARTQQLELGVSALVVPQRNPLVALKQLTTLDLLSGGRNEAREQADVFEEMVNGPGDPRAMLCTRPMHRRLPGGSTVRASHIAAIAAARLGTGTGTGDGVGASLSHGREGRMKRTTVPGGILALSLAIVLLAATAASPAQGASPGGLYVALGDSVAATPWRPPAGSYVDRLFLHYQSTLGVTQLSNRAQGGETSGSIRTGGQLDSALADINAASDTRAVTIDIGGNDALRRLCRGMTASGEIGPIWDSCPFRYNFFATLSDLKAALDSDPGPESFAAMAYYNPASGLGGAGQPYSEPVADRGLLGTDLAIDCETTAGTQVGLNDVIYQEAGRRGVLVADPYLAFKEGGQSFMGDPIHPNGAGHAAIAAAFREASAQCPDAGNLLLPTPPPSNEFSFGKVKQNTKKGTAKLTVEVPGPGELELAKIKKVMKADQESAEQAGKEKLSVKPKGTPKKKLNRKGKAKVNAAITYTPNGGEPNTERKKIKLIKR